MDSFFRWLTSAFRTDESDSLPPACLYKITFHGSKAYLSPPNGEASMLEWTRLKEVIVETNGTNPWGPDVYHVLITPDATLRVPQGAIGEEELLQRLVALQGFDHAAYMESIGCAGKRAFTCWRKRPLP